jgi:hypothetical protein
MLAAKAALAIRVDALGEDTNAELGLEHRAKLERRVRELEEGNVWFHLCNLFYNHFMFWFSFLLYD